MQFAAILSFVLAFEAILLYALIRNRKNQQRKQTKLPHRNMKTLDQLIAESKGKFFSVTFIKKDGTVRTINGKGRYRRLVKGGEYKGREAGYVPFVNRNRDAWVSAHKNAVVTFKCGKLEEQASVG